MSGRWQDRAPRSLLDIVGPRGESVTTPLDRRWLWRIAGDLSTCSTSETQRRIARDLSQYLHETCDHHWLHSERSEWRHPVTGEIGDVIPAHNQCLWCTEVDWLGGDAR
jgi:hypothetical protein